MPIMRPCAGPSAGCSTARLRAGRPGAGARRPSSLYGRLSRVILDEAPLHGKRIRVREMQTDSFGLGSDRSEQIPQSDSRAVHAPVFRLLLGRVSNGPFDVTALGVRMRCHPWDNVADGKLLFAPHRYCPKEFAILRRALSNGGVFVDVGANVGAFTLQAAVWTTWKYWRLNRSRRFERLKFNLAANDLGT